MTDFIPGQRCISDAELQIASGRKSQDYKGIARDSARLVELETAQMRANQYVANNQLIEEHKQTALEEIRRLDQSPDKLNKVRKSYTRSPEIQWSAYS